MPLTPDDPLEPLVPLVPDVPDDPLEPELPDVPRVPDDPELPDEPLLPLTPDVPDDPPHIQPSTIEYSPKFADTFTLPDTAQKTIAPNGCKTLLTVVKQQSTNW